MNDETEVIENTDSETETSTETEILIAINEKLSTIQEILSSSEEDSQDLVEDISLVQSDFIEPKTIDDIYDVGMYCLGLLTIICIFNLIRGLR